MAFLVVGTLFTHSLPLKRVWRLDIGGVALLHPVFYIPGEEWRTSHTLPLTRLAPSAGLVVSGNPSAISIRGRQHLLGRPNSKSGDLLFHRQSTSIAQALYLALDDLDRMLRGEEEDENLLGWVGGGIFVKNSTAAEAWEGVIWLS